MPAHQCEADVEDKVDGAELEDLPAAELDDDRQHTRVLQEWGRVQAESR
jgi:hypothetical protein